MGVLQDAREALGIRLAGSIVIVDEAHNLVAAVHDTHSALLSSQQIQTARSQLAAYYCRFQSRLATGRLPVFSLYERPYCFDSCQLWIQRDHELILLIEYYQSSVNLYEIYRSS